MWVGSVVKKTREISFNRLGQFFLKTTGVMELLEFWFDMYSKEHFCDCVDDSV